MWNKELQKQADSIVQNLSRISHFGDMVKFYETLELYTSSFKKQLESFNK